MHARIDMNTGKMPRCANQLFGAPHLSNRFKLQDENGAMFRVCETHVDYLISTITRYDDFLFVYHVLLLFLSSL